MAFLGVSINQNDFWYYRYVSQNCSVLYLFRICLRIVLTSFHIFSHTKLYENCSIKYKTWPKRMNEDLSFLVINHTNDAQHWNSTHLSTSWLIWKIISINELNFMLLYSCNILYKYYLNLTGPKHMMNIKFKIIFLNMTSYTSIYIQNCSDEWVFYSTGMIIHLFILLIMSLATNMFLVINNNSQVCINNLLTD